MSESFGCGVGGERIVVFVRSKIFVTSFVVVDVVKLLMLVVDVLDVIEVEVDEGAEVEDVVVAVVVVVAVQFSMLVDPVVAVLIPFGQGSHVDEFVASVALE